ncbi:iron-sulfur cluster assembly 1 homolog, mitochondrial-like [Halichondria panicea]|uniref:iron-sulfur cluster assembly 1 homolog, mitochondrial-like n=1 Tax=Halichondria panicea TaxID=6063 RepID=UPI00312B9616
MVLLGLWSSLAMAQAVRATVRAVKTSRKFVPRKAAIVLTPAASNKVKEMLSENSDALALRVGVRTRGCNGLSYTLEYTKQKEKFDEEVNQDGARLFVDAKAQLTLLGTEMDYVQSKLASEFIFNNPNVTGTCGCGESFNV